MATHYAVLGIDPSADRDTIRAAYRARARESHPDHGGDERQMMQVNEAWRILSDPALRAMYDAPSVRVAVVTSNEPRTILDFGRYSGWPVDAVANVDEDYLSWLVRTPAGLPWRDEIRRVLDERQVALDALRPQAHAKRRFAFR